MAGFLADLSRPRRSQGSSGNTKLFPSSLPVQGSDRMSSERERKKLEQAMQREREAAKRALTAGLRRALREPSSERSEDGAALIAAHPEEAAVVCKAIAKTARAQQQQKVNATEVEEDEASQRSKITTLLQMLCEAQHTVVYTGAGLSTAADIPDYRGPNGLWTNHNKGGGGEASSRNAPCAARAAMKQSFAEARPTTGHMALAALVAKGYVQHIISQNVDGLHMRSGVPSTKLCELHGNVFRERCPSCGKEYLRGFDVTGRSAYHRHGTERTCERTGCTGVTLRDTIVYFGERLHPPTLEVAQQQSLKADLSIFIGSSLKVLQAYPYIWQQPPKPAPRKRIVIINLQPTAKDKQADLRIHARCDAVLGMLLASLRVNTPNYSPAKDAVHKLALKLPPLPEVKPEVKGQVAEDKCAGGTDDEADEDDGAECDGAECDGVGDTSQASLPPRKRKRRGKATTWKKRSMPRAFPAGAQTAAPPILATLPVLATPPASAVAAAAAATRAFVAAAASPAAVAVPMIAPPRTSPHGQAAAKEVGVEEAEVDDLFSFSEKKRTPEEATEQLPPSAWRRSSSLSMPAPQPPSPLSEALRSSSHVERPSSHTTVSSAPPLATSSPAAAPPAANCAV